MEIFAIIILTILLLIFITYLFNKKKVDARMSRFNWLGSVGFCIYAFLLFGAAAVVFWVSEEASGPVAVWAGSSVALWSCRAIYTLASLCSLILAIKYFLNRDQLRRNKSAEVDLPKGGG